MGNINPNVATKGSGRTFGGTATWMDTASISTKADLSKFVGVGRYINYVAGAHNDLSIKEIQDLFALNKYIFLYWQNGKTAALEGFQRGVTDATEANRLADERGVPMWVPIVYAIDNPYTPQQVSEYFRGLLSVAGRPVGGYGSYDVIEYLATVPGIALLVQTLAWSSDRVSSFAHLYQRGVVTSGTIQIDEVVALQPFPSWTSKGALMANPLSYDQILAAFRWAGINYREYTGSRDRCRCHSGSHAAGGPLVRAWGPNVGTLVHITAGDLGSRTVEQYIRDIINGDPEVPFKAQFVVAPDGTVWINGVGRANHDGSMSNAAYAALRDGTFSLTGSQNLRGSDVTGNSFVYGIENINSGPPNAAQRNASVRICAAISHAQGWNGRDCAGHGEVASDRSFSDPGMDMGAFRRDVMAFVANPTNSPPPQEVPDMDANQAAQLQSIADRMTKIDYMHIILQWGFDPTENFQGAIYGEQGEVLQRLRRLGSLDQILNGVKQALIDDPDVPVDPAVLDAHIASALQTSLQAGFDAHISVNPEAVAAQQKALSLVGESDTAPSGLTDSEREADSQAAASRVDDSGMAHNHPPEPEEGDIEQPPNV